MTNPRAILMGFLLFQAISQAVRTVASTIGTSMMTGRQDNTKSLETSLNTTGLEKSARKSRSGSIGIIEKQGEDTLLTQQFQQAQRRVRVTVVRERRLALVMSLLVGVFALCYLPFWSVYVCLSFIPSCPPLSPFSMAMVQWMALLNSLANPVMYTVFHREFKLGMVATIRACFNF